MTTLDLIHYKQIIKGPKKAPLNLKSSAKAFGLNLEKTDKMPISGYHAPKEINCSEVCFDIEPIDSSVESVRLNDSIAVPDLNRSAVSVAQINALCKNHDHLNHKNFPQLEGIDVSIIIVIDNLRLDLL